MNNKAVYIILFLFFLLCSYVFGTRIGAGMERKKFELKQLEIYQSLEHRHTIAEEEIRDILLKMHNGECDMVVVEPGTYGSPVK